jgi:imidazolonepropionase-like amidohydrolase
MNKMFINKQGHSVRFVLTSKTLLSFITAIILLFGCSPEQINKKEIIKKNKPFPSTYQPLTSEAFIVEHATVLTGAGKQIDDASVLVENGKIKLVGKNIFAGADIKRYDGNGKWVTPGLIDVHSHLGVYASPGIESTSDGNEATSPVTAEVWAEHSVWTQDPGMPLALAGGVTTFQVLPGSANLIGGRGVTLKNVYARSVQGMKFPDAPHALKMACGENPKRVYGKEGGPSTRMGNVAGYRAAWIKAEAYRNKWDKYNESIANLKEDDTVESKEEEKPVRDLELDTLAEVLRGNILVHNHCYRAEEMLVMIDVAKEFGYKIAAFHHAIEAYKVADILAKENICAAVWADWWGFKHEAFDQVKENAAMVQNAKACAIIHSDSAIGIQHLNQEAAKAMAAGNKNGLSLEPKVVISWITSNPAKAIGVLDKTGSLEEGKMADLVIWSHNPFSIYAKAEKVFIDGALMYDRFDESKQPVSDFDLGITDPQGVRL